MKLPFKSKNLLIKMFEDKVMFYLHTYANKQTFTQLRIYFRSSANKLMWHVYKVHFNHHLVPLSII